MIGPIRFNPTNACILPRIEKKELQPLDEAETKLFLDAVNGHPLELLYTITLFTGMREGEALGLTWDCVDFVRGSILINKQLQKEKKPGGQFRLVSLKNDKPRRIMGSNRILPSMGYKKDIFGSFAYDFELSHFLVKYRLTPMRSYAFLTCSAQS